MDDSILCRLPAELREQIYSILLEPTLVPFPPWGLRYLYDLTVFSLCKQIYYESLRVFKRDNVFACIETPWAQAEHHIVHEGRVPIVSSGDKARSFRRAHLHIGIETSRDYETSTTDSAIIIVRVGDLPTFCRMWQYSELTYPGMNLHLILKLTVKNPNASEFNQDVLPKAIQKRLLEPFGEVRGLSEFTVQGDHYPSIEKAVRDAMIAPFPTPRECLEEATKLKDDGNTAIQKQDYEGAIRLYCEAFRSIHIICEGRFRHVWSDRYFTEEIKGGVYDGKHAQLIRMILRIKLVANMILAYLKMGEFDEAKFWGERTIRLIRTSVAMMDEDDDDYIQSFPAPNELGKIYYRTALAVKEFGDKIEARRLLRTAAKYLPRDNIVKEELASLSLRLG